MNTITRFSCALVLGVVLLIFSNAAWSLGLGAARVDSFLDQSLELSIELITRETDDLNTISVSLASAEDYELIGASRDDISVPLQFTVQGEQGSSSILVTSDLPIRDPVVRLIIEVDWASGRMLREYTVFLDPATISQSAPGPQPAATTSAAQEPSTPTPDSTTRNEAADAPAASASDASVNQTSSIPSAGEYGPVKSGDTLWRIAKDWSAGTDLNINKVMLAIQRTNPSAFAKKNINLLQRGAILRMPEITEVNSLSTNMANSEVRDQTAALNARQELSRSDTPLLIDENTAPEPADLYQTQEPEEELPSTDSEPQLSQEEQGQQAADSTDEPQLELVPPSQATASDSSYGFEETVDEQEESRSVDVLREALARKEEELINERQQNTYLEQKLNELESQLSENQAGTVGDEDLASMEQRLREERLAGDQDASIATPAATPERDIPKVAAAPKEPEPWYSSFMVWMIGLLLLVALIAGWIMNRRGGSEEIAVAAVGEDETLRGIKHEAEDVLRVLDTEETVVSKTEAADEPDDEGEETVVVPVSAETVEDKSKDTAEEGEAELLDEESADPEIQLDLARAYISMGDKEAARVILEEVIAHGSEKQKTEAVKMKGFL